MIRQVTQYDTLDDIMEYWSKKDVAVKLLSDYGIADVESVEDIELHEKDQYNKALILSVRDKSAHTNQKILIDVKKGAPSTDQVYDAIYEIGRDCNKRLIVFLSGDNIFDDDIPAADLYVVEGLITVMNTYPLNLSLFRVDKGSLTLTSYDTEPDEESFSKYPIEKLPTKEQFKYQEFWIVYGAYYKEGFSTPWQTLLGNFRDISNWGHKIYFDDYAYLTVWWDDSGLSYIIREMNGANGYLSKIWSLKKKELQEMYGEDDIQFDCSSKKSPKITVKYFDTPLEWLFNANPDEKFDAARDIFDAVLPLKNILVDVYVEYKKSLPV